MCDCIFARVVAWCACMCVSLRHPCLYVVAFVCACVVASLYARMIVCLCGCSSYVCYCLCGCVVVSLCRCVFVCSRVRVFVRL